MTPETTIMFDRLVASIKAGDGLLAESQVHDLRHALDASEQRAATAEAERDELQRYPAAIAYLRTQQYTDQRICDDIERLVQEAAGAEKEDPFVAAARFQARHRQKKAVEAERDELRREIERLRDALSDIHIRATVGDKSCDWNPTIARIAAEVIGKKP